MSFFTSIKDNFKQQGVVTQIIFINIAIFLTVNIVGNITDQETLTEYLSLPINGEGFLKKFWTLFTYMFTHEGLLHIIWNLIAFYFFSQIFLVVFGQKKLLYIYVMSGICGGALVLLIGILFPAAFVNTILLGASAAVLGIGGVMLIYSPNYRVYLFGLVEMSFKYIYLIMFAISTIIDLRVNTGGKISHIGGALFGVLYGYQLKRGRDLSDFSFLKPKKKTNLKVVSNTSNSKTQGNSPNDDAAMNALLDKISKSGYDSLTKAEKDLLFKLSQKK